MRRTQGVGIGREFLQQLAQPEVEVGFLGGLLGGHRQIEAPDRAEIRLPGAVGQQGLRLVPACIASQGELIEIGAALTIGKVERRGQGQSAHLQRPLLASLGEGPAIVVAVVRVRRIGFGTSWAQCSHGNLAVRFVARLVQAALAIRPKQ